MTVFKNLRSLQVQGKCAGVGIMEMAEPVAELKDEAAIDVA